MGGGTRSDYIFIRKTVEFMRAANHFNTHNTACIREYNEALADVEHYPFPDPAWGSAVTMERTQQESQNNRFDVNLADDDGGGDCDGAGGGNVHDVEHEARGGDAGDNHVAIFILLHYHHHPATNYLCPPLQNYSSNAATTANIPLSIVQFSPPLSPLRHDDSAPPPSHPMLQFLELCQQPHQQHQCLVPAAEENKKGLVRRRSSSRTNKKQTPRKKNK